MQKKGGDAKKHIAKMAIRAMSTFLSQRKQKPLDEASLEKKKTTRLGSSFRIAMAEASGFEPERRVNPT